MSCCRSSGPYTYSPPVCGVSSFVKNDFTYASTKWYVIALLVTTVVLFAGGAFLGGLGAFPTSPWLQESLFVVSHIGYGGCVALLSIGCIFGSAGIVVLFIWKVKVNKVIKSFDEGAVPLHRAARAGDVEAIERLVSEDVNEKDGMGRTPLHEAIRFNKPKAIRALLRRGASNAGTPLFANAICYALAYNQEKAVAILIETGATINYQENPDVGPCHAAITILDLNLLRTLIARGADVSLKGRGGDTALHHAAQRANHSELLKVLLDKGADVNSQNSFQRETPLHLASRLGIESFVAVLLEYGANVDIPNVDGNTPLHLAALKARASTLIYTKIIQALLAQHAMINLQNKNGETPLFLAAYSGSAAAVNELLNSGANPDISDKERNTPLHIALQQGRLGIAELLLEKTNVNIQNNEGNTPLHIALQKGHLEFAKLLLAKANPNIQNNYGNTPLHIALQLGHLDIAKLLLAKANVNIQNNQGNTPLHIALQLGHLDIAKLLLAKANVNIQNNNGAAALTLCLNFCHSRVDILQELLNHGADPNIPDKEGNLPLHIAVQSRDLRAVKLLAKKANLNIQNNNGQTALTLCLTSGHGTVEIFQELLNQGANPDIPDKAGNTTLHIAADSGILEAVKLLVKKANPNIQNNNGQTALSLCFDCYPASRIGKFYIIQELLNHGANPEIRDNLGATALFIALQQRWSLETIDLLLRREVNINAQDLEGKTALRIALDQKQFDIVEGLLARKARTDIPDNKGQTLLHAAILLRDAEEIDSDLFFLFLNGGDINTQDHKGQTPLHLAVQTNKSSIIDLLLLIGSIKINIADHKGKTPVDIVVKKKLSVAATSLRNKCLKIVEKNPDKNMLEALDYDRCGGVLVDELKEQGLTKEADQIEFIR